MTEQDNEWSVASVFYALPTCHSVVGDVGPLPQVRPGSFDFRDHLPQHPPAPLEIDNSCKNVESVADCIRQLGYTVRCGTGGEGGASRGGREKYAILSISKKRFYYGSELGTCYQYLSGKRSVYKGFLRWRESLRAAAAACATDKEMQEAEEKKLFKLIDDGSICNKNWENWDIWETGVSTIGNTLPNDIVQALQDFRSDCPDFVRNPGYEFYIPPCMQELPESCPPPESANNQGGGGASAAPSHATAVAAPAQATAVAAPAQATAVAAPAQATAVAAPSQATAVAAPAQATAVAAPSHATAVAAPASKKVPTGDSSDSSDSDEE